jgi:Ala-tRNA(Pro) deacylase
MISKKLKEYLDSQQVKYVTVTHSVAYTSQEVAAHAHISGHEVAKTVMVQLDGRMAMAVVPASLRVDLEALKALAGATAARLAHETDFKELFPDCETGAMPPFGNLYGLPVYVADKLAEDEQIAFNAGSHNELIKLAFKDFERLVQPKVGRLTAR